MSNTENKKLWPISAIFFSILMMAGAVFFNFSNHELPIFAKASVFGVTSYPAKSFPLNLQVAHLAFREQQENFHSAYLALADQKRIAITFDDGPSAEHTDQVLDALRERGIRATFFVVGQNVKAYPEVVQRIAADGHEIGNHTWGHANLARLSADKIQSQIQDTQNIVKETMGIAPSLMRPPYGSYSKRVIENVGLPMIMWSVDPQDWRVRNKAAIISRVVGATRNGSIILLHDIHSASAAAVPEILDQLLAQGYEFVTVSQLLGFDKGFDTPVAGKAYFKGYQVK